MNEPSEHAIYASLATVVEPCSVAMGRKTDIVSMGLVERIDKAAGHVTVTLCLTDAACVHFSGMQRYIRDALLPLEGVASVSVVQTTDVLWTPDRAERRIAG